jgi:NAD(P)H-dependent flavin oxidoreductase YrpB (nitropropane dioxygenase family)
MLGIEHPVLLAPMDLVSGGRLAAAVRQAGGLGLLGGGYGDSKWIDREGIEQAMRGLVVDFDVAGVIAGEACALIHDIVPARETSVERIVAQAERLMVGNRA